MSDEELEEAMDDVESRLTAANRPSSNRPDMTVPTSDVSSGLFRAIDWSRSHFSSCVRSAVTGQSHDFTSFTGLFHTILPSFGASIRHPMGKTPMRGFSIRKRYGICGFAISAAKLLFGRLFFCRFQS
jgi:hypothetical protein